MTTTEVPPTTSITDLTDAERTVVLRRLLEAQPELLEEAEQLAAAAAGDVEEGQAQWELHEEQVLGDPVSDLRQHA